MNDIPRILIVGGGYVGMYAALRLQRKLRRTEASVTVVDPQPTMTYQPFLAEAAGGSIEPRHVVVPLRKVLPRCRVVTGTVTGVDTERRVAAVRSAEGDRVDLPYDILVLAAGSLVADAPDPGVGRARDRLHHGRRGGPPAQPCPLPAGPRLQRGGSGPAPGGADLRRGRRRLLRRRSARRAGGPGPVRAALPSRTVRRGPAVGACRSGRPDPAGGRACRWPSTRSSGCGGAG